MTAFGLSLRGRLRLFDELRSVGQDKSSQIYLRSVISALPAQRHLSPTSVASSQPYQRSVISALPA
ncbi:hypothetical protein EKG38_01720 [Shewanella canadensis]|uniref:Uncharacterized protein n=1 Tax=Shewanella canadensis TaxID=271096 RepID=A0A3S0LQ34_9GAMM|nr:hypothetical protein [Shewanella canadensis]RTR40661.1 hypothetical protein EKG38_01720 [Shewanella canadensis]